MEEKIQQIMNDEELKEKIIENVDIFKERLNLMKKLNEKRMKQIAQKNKI